MSTMRSRTIYGIAMAVTALLIATACSTPTQTPVVSNGVAAITGSPEGQWQKVGHALVLDTSTTSGVYPDAPAPLPGSDDRVHRRGIGRRSGPGGPSHWR